MTGGKKDLERDMLLGLKSGDILAFEKLYEKYSPVIYANIIKFLKDNDIAEDLLQDVFMKIWENRDKIDPDQSFLAYLIVSSRNIVFNFKKRLKLEVESAIILSVELLRSENAIDKMIESKETMLIIDQIISQLPDQRQKIFRLAKIEGMSYQQIANEVGISVSTVRDHIVKANKFIHNYANDDQLLIMFLAGILIF